MSAIFSIIITILKLYGIDIRSFFLALRRTPRFISQVFEYNRLVSNKSGAGDAPKIKFLSLRPFLLDASSQASALGGYFYQDLWAARIVYKLNPKRHIDVGSRIDGFVGHLMVFRDVEVIDIRPLVSLDDHLRFVQADATNLNLFANDSIESLSSLHAAEHFGLGRYGDPIDPHGHLKFMHELQRVLAVNGRLLFSVPLGRDVVYFNAQRSFDPLTIISIFDALDMLSLTVVDRRGGATKVASVNEVDLTRHNVGLFEFTKPG